MPPPAAAHAKAAGLRGFLRSMHLFCFNFSVDLLFSLFFFCIGMRSTESILIGIYWTLTPSWKRIWYWKEHIFECCNSEKSDIKSIDTLHNYNYYLYYKSFIYLHALKESSQQWFGQYYYKTWAIYFGNPVYVCSFVIFL